MLVASMTVSSLTGCGSTAEESKDTTSKNNVEKTDNSKTSNVRRNFDKQDGYFKRLKKRRNPYMLKWMQKVMLQKQL